MKVFDMHSDIFTDIVNRRMMGEKQVFDKIHFPKLKAGGVDTVICAVWVEPRFSGNEMDRFHYILQQVKSDLAECNHVRVIKRYQDIVENDLSKINIILGLEGLTFIEQVEDISFTNKIEAAFSNLNRDHFQHAILTYDQNNFLAGSSALSNNKGLSEIGNYAITKMIENNWMIDISHLSDQSAHDICRIAKEERVPVMASHSNARSRCNHPRNLTNEQIKTIALSKGIIGINAFGEYVHTGKPTLDHFIDHIIYISELVGIEYVAFGFDFMDYLLKYNLNKRYGNFPEGLKDVTMIPNLLERMITRGFSHKEMEAICFQNALQFYSRVNNSLTKFS